jgi:hypothetical protein
MDEETQNIEFTIQRNTNFRELAKEFKSESSSLAGKLYVALLVGNGIVIILLISTLLDKSTEPNFQSLILISIWFFIGSLVLCYFSGNILVTYYEFKTRENLALGNMQDVEENIRDIISKSGGISKLSEVSKKKLEDERLLVLEHRGQADRHKFVSRNASITYLGCFYLSVIAFGLGLLIPLISISVHDYF